MFAIQLTFYAYFVPMGQGFLYVIHLSINILSLWDKKQCYKTYKTFLLEWLKLSEQQR
jgi:hypothetical protein